MTDLEARQRGGAALLAFDVVRHPFDPQLVELFDDLNARHFDGLLPVVPVCQGIPEGAGEREDLNGLLRVETYPSPGESSEVSATIHMAEELFQTAWGSEADRWLKITDTLLHQMVHLAVHLDALGGAHPFESHHGPCFTDECNRIGGRAGWTAVVASAPGIFPDQDAAGWPDNAITAEDGALDRGVDPEQS